jgi:hypothetical protein
MDRRILIPVPVGQGELAVAGQVLTDRLEEAQIGPVPVEEMVGAMLALEKARRIAVDRRLRQPAARVAARQVLHRLDRLAIGVEIGVDLGRAGAKAPADRPVADLLAETLAAAQRRKDERSAGPAEALDEHPAARVAEIVGVDGEIGRKQLVHGISSSLNARAGRKPFRSARAKAGPVLRKQKAFRRREESTASKDLPRGSPNNSN